MMINAVCKITASLLQPTASNGRWPEIGIFGHSPKTFEMRQVLPEKIVQVFVHFGVGRGFDRYYPIMVEAKTPLKYIYRPVVLPAFLPQLQSQMFYNVFVPCLYFDMGFDHVRVQSRVVVHDNKFTLKCCCVLQH